jgi:hypothetical protein
MRPYTPTLGARETGKNTREFVKDNNQTLWTIAKPLIPWIVGFYLLDTIITIFFFPESKNGFQLFSIFAGFLFTVLVITWHRVVIHGPDNYTPMNMFKPKRHEWAFIGMGILLGILFFIATLLSGITMSINIALGSILLIITVLGAMYLWFRFCFYFPAKAVDNSITLKQSFKMTNGYFWKVMGATFFGFWRIVLIMMTIIFASTFFIEFLTGDTDNAMLTHGFTLLTNIPLLIYFYPITYTLGVTIVSNYYQHALQNKPDYNDQS